MDDVTLTTELFQRYNRRGFEVQALRPVLDTTDIAELVRRVAALIGKGLVEFAGWNRETEDCWYQLYAVTDAGAAIAARQLVPAP
jgi:hypothetical protein